MTDSSNSAQKRDVLRKQLRTARNQLSDTAVNTFSQQIINQLYPLLTNAKHIAGYLPLGKEVDITAALAHCQRDNKHTYLPVVITDNQMLFMPYATDTPLVANQFGILEPAADYTTSCHPTKLDAVIVPLVGFDESCNRMGMGGGYYDRAFACEESTANSEDSGGLTLGQSTANLAQSSADSQSTANRKSTSNRPLMIGVAFDVQQVDSVFAEWWDVPLDYIVTQSQIHTRL